jgi:hypothetical protein
LHCARRSINFTAGTEGSEHDIQYELLLNRHQQRISCDTPNTSSISNFKPVAALKTHGPRQAEQDLTG